MRLPKRLPNFRDLGGIPALGNKRVRAARLLRSGELSNLADEDKKILAEDYALAAVIDLRGESEISRRPDILPDGVDYYNIDMMKAVERQSTSFENLEAFNNREGIHDFMKACYRLMVEEEEARRGLRRFIDILLEQQEGAVLFHCFAGKDRTGLCAAAVLTLLGASKESIYADYLLTNELRREENERILRSEKFSAMSEEQKETAKILFLVRKEYLDTAYQLAEARYGSLEEFLRRGVGISEDETEQLKRMYLE